MQSIPLDDGVVFPATRRVLREGREQILTPRESAMLHYLARQSPRAVSVEELLEEVCGLHPGTATHTVQTCIYTLRRKIERVPAAPQRLVRAGRGAYRFVYPTSTALRTALESAELLAGIDSDAAAAVLETVARLPGLPAQDLWALQIQLGLVRQRQGRVRDAARALEGPDRGCAPLAARAGIVRGLIAFREGRAGEARAAWRDARTRARGDESLEASAMFHLGLLRWREPAVLEEWACLAGLLPPRAATLVRSAAAQGWLALGDPERALDVAVEVSGPHPYELRLLGEVRALAWSRLGELSRARTVWTQAAAVDSGSARLAEPYGWGVRMAWLRTGEQGPAMPPSLAGLRRCPFSRQIAASVLHSSVPTRRG